MTGPYRLVIAGRARVAILRIGACGKTVRRWLLPTTRHHVYYTVDEARRTVTIRMIWHAGRGRGPKL